MNPLRWLFSVAMLLASLPALAADGPGGAARLAAPTEESPAAQSPVAIRAWFSSEGGAGTLSVQATLADGWHTYSVTDSQRSQQTKIALRPSGEYKQSGPVRATSDPERTYVPQSQQTIEKHRGVVTWTVPIRFADGVDPTGLQIKGHLELQACNAVLCQPFATEFAAAHQGHQGIVVAEAPAAELAVEQFATALQQDKFEDVLGGGFRGASGGGAGEKVTLKASVERAPGGKPNQLVIEATIQPGWHIYSLTQPKGGSLPTTIDVKFIGDAKLAGQFKPIPAPKVHFSDVFKVNLEEHEGTVRWIAPLEVADGAENAGLKIYGTLSYQACNEGSCLPPKDVEFVALDTTKKAAATHVGEYRAPSSNVIIRGHIEPRAIAPGGTVKVVVSADPQGEYHVYPVKEKPKTAKPTLLAVSGLPPGWTAGEPMPDKAPVAKGGDVHHEGPVTWTIEVKAPKDAKPGAYNLEGGIAYMACVADKFCEPPKGALFEATVEVSAIFAGAVDVGSAGKERRPLTFFASNYVEVEKRSLGAAEAARRAALRERIRPGINFAINATDVELYSHDLLNKFSSVDLNGLQDTQSGKGSGGLWAILISLGGGFLGGLLLNVMPCVLPVIGLKIMSFVQQGGESRGRIFLLNLWFSLGLISVFMVLAGLAAFLNLSWGGQFQEGWFTILLTCVVFAFALALIGVWEVPIPGFIGSSGAVNDLAAKEGAGGAFSKGVLTTVLATPCTGPFLGPALTWAVQQPLPLVFATFLAVGLGMASPYLIIGAYPKLIAFLPKPGMWMETFKKLMGFILLATVVWLLSFVPATDVLPTVTVLCGLGLAFWWIGSTPLTEPAGKRMLAWAQGGVVIAAVALFSFAWFDDFMRDKAERRFKSDMVSRLVKFGDKPEDYQKAERPNGRYTVMVDFTADWCLTCKTNEQLVLSSKRTQELIEKNNVVFLVADLTNSHPEAEELLVRLGNKQRTIPYVAIFPADNPNQPIVLDGLLTQGQIDRALEKAGPSKVADGTTAMRTP